jgi:hypothetical protein
MVPQVLRVQQVLKVSKDHLVFPGLQVLKVLQVRKEFRDLLV